MLIRNHWPSSPSAGEFGVPTEITDKAIQTDDRNEELAVRLLAEKRFVAETVFQPRLPVRVQLIELTR